MYLLVVTWCRGIVSLVSHLWLEALCGDNCHICRSLWNYWPRASPSEQEWRIGFQFELAYSSHVLFSYQVTPHKAYHVSCGRKIDLL
jgi:hypothetical protein